MPPLPCDGTTGGGTLWSVPSNWPQYLTSLEILCRNLLTFYTSSLLIIPSRRLLLFSIPLKGTSLSHKSQASLSNYFSPPDVMQTHLPLFSGLC